MGSILDKSFWPAVWRRLRGPLIVFAALLAAALFWQVLPIELAAWFGGELVLYIELVVAAWLATGRTSPVRLFAAMKPWLGRMVARLRRPRSIRTRRPPSPLKPPEDPEPWGIWVVRAA